MLRGTQAMIGQHFDDAAFGDLAAMALDDHALEFALERLQTIDTAFYLVKLASGDAVSGLAGSIGVVSQIE